MKRSALVAGTAASLIAGSALAAPSAFAAGTLPNGFTAAVVAQSGQTIRGAIDASGYDLGIYIGPGVHNVRVDGARVTGAHDQGILVQDAHNVLIRNSTVEGNALSHLPQLEEVKGIVVAGSRGVIVTGNTVEGNGDGGIGVYDDGPNSTKTFAPIAIDQTAVPGVGNIVTGNTIRDNFAGCGIVVAAKNPGGGLERNVVSFNRVVYGPPLPGKPPFTGGIVVAGGEFGPVTVDRTMVLHNTVTGGIIPGISLHAGRPHVLSRTFLVDNTLAHNGGAPGATHGIEIAGAPDSISGTQVVHDRVIDDTVGVFHVGDTGTNIVALQTSGVTQPVAP